MMMNDAPSMPHHADREELARELVARADAFQLLGFNAVEIAAMVRQQMYEESVCSALCRSGKFETGEGTCAFVCMDQLGDARKGGCRHAQTVHAKLAKTIVAATNSAPRQR